MDAGDEDDDDGVEKQKTCMGQGGERNKCWTERGRGLGFG